MTSFSSTGFHTRAIHSGVTPDPTTGALLTPIFQTATYVQTAVGVNQGYTYSRTANPTVTALEKKLAALENVDYACCFSTGLAATTALFLALLKAGDHVICSDVVYGGTVRLLQQVLSAFGVESTFVDTSTPAAVKAALQKNTRLIFIETPANPTLKLTDIAAIAGIAHDHHLPLVVDNTFLTAALQKPFLWGADIVLYSTTKYIDGHNATVGGALLTPTPAVAERFAFIRNAVGSIQAPFDAWLTLQGIKTLPLRMQQHSVNALAVATYLAAHSAVQQVIYPGLSDFPQVALMQRQQQGAGGMLAFELKGGYAAAAELMRRVQLCRLAENLGAVETLITHPASMTHGPLGKEGREAVGITEGLVRLSVGLEDAADIIQDLSQALSS